MWPGCASSNHEPQQDRHHGIEWQRQVAHPPRGDQEGLPTPTRWRPTRSKTCTSRSSRASTCRSAARQAAARPRCSLSSGLLDTPSERQIRCWMDTRLPGSTPTERARVRNRQIGFIFQAFNLIGDLNVYENVELPLTYRGMTATERKRARARGAGSRGDGAPRQALSPPSSRGGQQQRVAVARAVAGDPAILLADEPTGNLDSVNGEAVMDLLRRTPHRTAPRSAWSRTIGATRRTRIGRCTSLMAGSSMRSRPRRCTCREAGGRPSDHSARLSLHPLPWTGPGAPGPSVSVRPKAVP